MKDQKKDPSAMRDIILGLALLGLFATGIMGLVAAQSGGIVGAALAFGIIAYMAK